MMLQRQFTGVALFSILAACGGSVEQIGGGDGDGDGDGDAYGDGDSYGDGDTPVPGDGDYYGDGDTPVPGDGDYYGDGDRPVPGDGDYYGDGDLIVPGVGGGGPILPPGSGGSGGGIIVPPTGGGPGVIPIGPPIDPATCSPSYEYNDVYYCEQQVECPGTWAYVWCDSSSGGGQCSCDRNGGYFSVSVDAGFVAGGAGCDRMMEACLGGGELEVIGDPVCRTDYLEQNQNYCGTNLYCETPVEFGDSVGSIQTWSDAWCENYDDAWVCNCYSGNSSGQITFSDELTSPDVCYDAIGACGSALIDPNLPSSCAPRSQWAQNNSCSFELECTQGRTINGNQVEVSAWQSGGCQLIAEGEWSCSCGGTTTSFAVAEAAAWDACSVASARCGD